ncbi:hypothetical protein JW859_02180 [bacterium]|nr:hypothetical protein [bacterium]
MLVPPPDRALPDKLDRALAAAREELRRRHWLVAVVSSRRFWFIIALILVSAAAITIPWYSWYLAPNLDLNIAIVDKTAPFKSQREHRGLFWLLGQNKFVDTRFEDELRWYDYENDYIGFYPPDQDTIKIEPEEEPTEPEEQAVAGGSGVAYASETPQLTEDMNAGDPAEDPSGGNEESVVTEEEEAPQNMAVYGNWTTQLLLPERIYDRDVLYIADTYGVYTGDYLENAGMEVEHSQRIFGGFEEQEVEAIEWFAQQGRLLIGEFNCFASPTNEELRKRMEHIYGITWKRWTGRYFINFADSTDVPYWLLKRWEEENGRPWDLEGPGYLLVHEDSEDYILLREGIEINRRGVEMYPLPQYADLDVMQGVKNCTFCYWFDIIEAQEGTEVLAEYDCHLTITGRALLAQRGLKSVFPAVTRKRDIFVPLGEETVEIETADEPQYMTAARHEAQRRAAARSSDREYLAYYLAGDMCDYDRDMGPSHTRLTMYINRSFYEQPVVGSHGFFFWHTYYPLVTNILRAESNRLTGRPDNVYLFK